MAYSVCSDTLKNIGVQCNEQAIAGFTGRAIICQKAGATYTQDANGDVLTLASDNLVLVDNQWANAFDGTQNAEVVDNGRPQWHRDWAFRIPRVRDGRDTRDNVKALARTNTLALLEREDGTILALGFNGKMVATAQTQAENANGGDWVTTLGTDEGTPETLFVDTPASGDDPAVSAKEKFETLWQSIIS